MSLGGGFEVWSSKWTYIYHYTVSVLSAAGMQAAHKICLRCGLADERNSIKRIIFILFYSFLFLLAKDLNNVLLVLDSCKYPVAQMTLANLKSVPLKSMYF